MLYKLLQTYDSLRIEHNKNYILSCLVITILHDFSCIHVLISCCLLYLLLRTAFDFIDKLVIHHILVHIKPQIRHTQILIEKGCLPHAFQEPIYMLLYDATFKVLELDF